MGNLTVEPMPGDHIDFVAQKMCEMAAAHGETVHAKFNGTAIEAAPGDVASAVVGRWNVQMEAERKAYRESPEGRAAAARRVKAIREKQAMIADLMGELETIDLSNRRVAIYWIRRFMDPSDDVDVTKRVSEIVERFRAAGYEPNANCGEKFKKDDHDNVAVWIVGQALAGMEFCGTPHPMIGEWIAQWLRQDLRNQSPPPTQPERTEG